MLLLLLNIYSTFREPKNTLTAEYFFPCTGFLECVIVEYFLPPAILLK